MLLIFRKLCSQSVIFRDSSSPTKNPGICKDALHNSFIDFNNALRHVEHDESHVTHVIRQVRYAIRSCMCEYGVTREMPAGKFLSGNVPV